MKSTLVALKTIISIIKRKTLQYECQENKISPGTYVRARRQSCLLKSQHPLGVPVHFLPIQLLTQLPADVSEKAVEDRSSPGAPVPTWENPDKAPSFQMAHP